MSRSALALALFLLIAAAPLSSAQDTDAPRETCQDVATRILTPPMNEALVAEWARAKYDQWLALWVEELRTEQTHAALTEFIALGELREAEREVELQKDAVDDARAGAETAERARIAELREAATVRREAGAVEQADDLEAQAAASESALADGSLRFEVPGESRSRTAAGWKEQLDARAQSVARMGESVAAGTYRVDNPGLGKRLTWNSAKSILERVENDFVRAAQGKASFRFATLGQRYDRHGVEARLERALKTLRETRASIRAGTYAVSLSLGYRGDRNHVLGLIEKAEQSIRDKHAAWAAKTYQHTHKNGTRPTNGSIEEEIAAAQKVIDDKKAEGDDASIWVPEAGRNVTARECKEKLAEARMRGDSKAANTWSTLLRDWQIALNDWVVKQLEVKQAKEAKLALHRELFEADIAKVQADIDGRLTRVLDETPCAGGPLVEADPNLARVEDHLRVLRGSGETDEESYRRVDDYEDRIYVGRDGRVHGDLRDALANAMRDTGVRKPGTLEVSSDLFLEVQGWIGKVTSLGAGEEWIVGWREAQKVIDDFVRAVGELDPNASDFFHARRLLRTEYLPKLEQALTRGALSVGQIDSVLETLRSSGGSLSRTRDLIALLERVRDVTPTLSGPWLQRLGTLFSSEESFGADPVATWQRLSQAGGGFDFKLPRWAEMSKFERGMTQLALVGAVAQTWQNAQRGMSFSEAAARSAVDLAIDFAISGMPITAAAEAATTVLFNVHDLYAEEKGAADATLSGVSKAVARGVIDKIADGFGYMGHGTILLERWIDDEPGMDEVLLQVDRGKLERSLATVERQLDAIEPGHPDEARLMRMRAAFRRLLRAQALASHR